MDDCAKELFPFFKVQVFINTEAFMVHGCSIEKRLEGVVAEMVKFASNV